MNSLGIIKKSCSFLKEIQKDFLSIKDVHIKVISMNFSGTARVLWNPLFGYKFIINPIRVMDMNELSLKGLIAHELSHVEQLFEYNLFYRIYESFINHLRINYFPRIRKQEVINKIEIDADYRAIKRGYGQELISLTRFEMSKKIKNKNKYLTISEIKDLIKKNK